MPVAPFEVKNFLREVLVPTGGYQDSEVDATLLEIKNYKNINNLEAMVLMSSAVQVLLDQCGLHKAEPDRWKNAIKSKFKPFQSVWTYLRHISDEQDRCECIFDLYEYCQNPKRPHLQKGFPHIFTSLLAGDIICPVSAAQFVDAMKRSEDGEEQQQGEQLAPLLTQSCPW